MANICDNTFYTASENKKNIETIINFFEKEFPDCDYDYGDSSVDIYFSSKWTFPEEAMNKLYDSIPDKSDIYMRCLSVEYGCLYHALWVCDSDGWKEV